MKNNMKKLTPSQWRRCCPWAWVLCTRGDCRAGRWRQVRLASERELWPGCSSGQPVAGAEHGRQQQFQEGALTANRLGAVWESKLSKGDSGFVLNASTFYDDVYHQRNDNKGPISTAGPVNEFNSAAKRYGGGYSRLLIPTPTPASTWARPVPRCVWASRW
jgi:hypothetical protein